MSLLGQPDQTGVETYENNESRIVEDQVQIEESSKNDMELQLNSRDEPSVTVGLENED